MCRSRRYRPGNEPVQLRLTGLTMQLWRWLLLVFGVALLAACEGDGRATPAAEPSLPVATKGEMPAAATATPAPRLELAPTRSPGAMPGPATSAVGQPPNAVTPAGSPSPDAGGDMPAPLPDVHTSFLTPPDRDLVELARSLRLKTATPIERIVGPPVGELVPGRVDEFWLTSLEPVRVYLREFVLRLVSPNAYWYVQAGLDVPDEDVLRAAEAFESDVYPRTTDLWGTEWKPGVDEDPRLTILNGRLRGGAAGYFSSADEYPAAVHEHSNQREMLYMNAEYLKVRIAGLCGRAGARDVSWRGLGGRPQRGDLGLGGHGRAQHLPSGASSGLPYTEVRSPRRRWSTGPLTLSRGPTTTTACCSSSTSQSRWTCPTIWYGW